MQQYKNYLPVMDINRNEIEFMPCFDVLSEPQFLQFATDLNGQNDVIEKNLLKNKAYKEAVIISLRHKDNNLAAVDLLKEQQKSFSGAKLYYISETGTQLLVLSVPDNIEGKVHMVISRLNKINEKVHRENSKIKKQNDSVSGSNSKQDKIVSLFNKELRV